MRDKTFYKEKTEAIRNEVLAIQKKGETFCIDDPFNSYPGIYEAIREFIHIVYSFDKDLPLNKELDELTKLRFMSFAIGGNSNFVNKDFEKVISKIDFFLHYLDTYIHRLKIPLCFVIQSFVEIEFKTIYQRLFDYVGERSQRFPI